MQFRKFTNVNTVPREKPAKAKSSLNEIEIKLSVLQEALSSLTDAVSVLQTMKSAETNLLFKSIESNFPDEGIAYQNAVKRYEINLIKAALRETKGNQTRAAKLLQLKISTLHAIIKRHKIKI